MFNIGGGWDAPTPRRPVHDLSSTLYKTLETLEKQVSLAFARRSHAHALAAWRASSDL